MSTAETVRATKRGEQTRPVELATPKEDLLTVIFGACMIGGVFADAWAHKNILSEVQAEGFFTLWHGLLYAGFTATAAWTFYLAYRRRDRAPRWWIDGWPAGYKVGALGVLIFGAGGLGDMFWHTVFGIEVSIDALLSPSHLLLVVGSTLLLSSPTRSWWADGGSRRRTATAVAALALATMAASVFLGYALIFQGRSLPVLPYDGTEGSVGHLQAAHGVTSYVVTAALLAFSVLLVHRRRATPGVVTAVTAIVALFPVVTAEFPSPQTAAALAAIGGAAVADWVLVALDRVRGVDATMRLPIAGAVVGALIAAPHLLALDIVAGVRWPIELWSGSVAVAGLAGMLVGGLASRPHDYAAAR
jgi:hypothetical protein